MQEEVRVAQSIYPQLREGRVARKKQKGRENMEAKAWGLSGVSSERVYSWKRRRPRSEREVEVESVSKEDSSR